MLYISFLYSRIYKNEKGSTYEKKNNIYSINFNLDDSNIYNVFYEYK